MRFKSYLLTCALSGLPMLATAAAVPMDSLTYNRDIWQRSVADVSASHSQSKWNKNGAKASTSAGNLTFWNQPINKIELSGAAGKTRELNIALYNGKLLSSQESLKLTKAWGSLISQKTSSKAKQLASKNISKGVTQYRTIWESNDSIILLSNTKSSGNQKIAVSFMHKAHALSKLEIPNTGFVTRRSFYSAADNKTFSGKLYGYDDKKQVARIEINNKISSIKMDTLCKEDQEYIKEMNPYVSIYRGVNFRFTETKDKPVKKGQLSISNVNYEITLQNRSETLIEGIDVKYYIYFYKGDVNKKGSVLNRIVGSKSMSKLYPKYTDKIVTTALELTKNVVRGQAGG